MRPSASALTENILTGQGRVQNKSLGSRFEVLGTPGPSSDRHFRGNSMWKQPTALLFLSLHIFVLQKQLARMQDFGHACCCQPMVVLGMIESTAKRFFFPCIETENCHLHFSSQHKHLSERPKKVDFYTDIYTKVQMWNLLYRKKKTYSKIKIDFQWGKQKCNHVNH